MLKNILSLLLSKFYSKQESEAVGHQAMPKLSQYIDLTSNATANVENTYVAPTDGYFVCATKGGELSGVNVWGTLDAGVPGASGIQGKVFTPCVKGASVHYIIYGTIHLVRFYKTIGGGVQTLKSALLQGGGLCRLSHWYSSLRRSSLQARSLGYTKTLSLLRTTLSRCSQVRQEFQNEATQRRLMEWPLSLLEKHRQRIFPVSWMSTVSGDNSSKTLSKDGKLTLLFTSLRATFSMWQREVVTQRSVSSYSTQRLNLTVGGASC